MGAQVAPAPAPPPPIATQHSSVVGSQLVEPQAMGVSGMPLSPIVPASVPGPPPSTPPRPPSKPVLASTPRPPSWVPPLLLLPDAEPLLDPLLLEPPLPLDLPASPVPSLGGPLRSSSRTVRPPQPAKSAIATSATVVPACFMTRAPFLVPAKESLR
jgi:hypothetical protein